MNAFENQASRFQLAVAVGHGEKNNQIKTQRLATAGALVSDLMEPNPAHARSLQPAVTACCFAVFEGTALFKA